MVSLADIAFLIIFFFMLSSTFMNDKSAIALPVLPKASETTSAFAVTLAADGSLSLDDAHMATPADLESALRAKLVGQHQPQRLRSALSLRQGSDVQGIPSGLRGDCRRRRRHRHHA